MMKKNKKEVKEELKVELDLFYGDKKLNDFMHYADVFERGKQLADYEQFIITGNPNLEKICENVKNALEGTDKNVVFVAIRNINGERVDDPKAYIKPNTQTISMGKKFGLFKDLLETLKYKVQVSQNMEVLSVSV